MKDPRPACLLCRHIVAAKGGAHPSPWQLQISQYSTKPTSTSEDFINIAMGINSRKPPPRQSQEYGFRKITMTDQANDAKIKWARTAQRFQHPKKRMATRNPNQQVDALFKQIVEQQALGQELKPGTSKNSEVKVALFKIAKDLGESEHMVIKGESAVKVWNHFKTVILPTLSELNMRIPTACRTTLERTLKYVYDAKIEAMRSPELPAVSEILLDNAKFAGVQPRKWNRIVGALVKELVEMDPSTANEDGLITQEDMLNDLIQCWKVLSLPSAAHANAEDEVLEGFWFPRLDKYSLKRFSEKGNFPEAFSKAFPHFRMDQIGPPTAILAIATHALLIDPQRSNQVLRRRATRLISRVGYLITYVNYRQTALRSHVAQSFPALENYVMTQWTKIKQDLKERIGVIDPSAVGAESRDALPPDNREDINERSLTYHLHLAIPARNTREVDWRWTTFLMAPPGTSDPNVPPARAKILKNYPDIFDLFIYTRMALNQPEKALQALRTLRSVGIKPTLKTWNVMLDGCKKAHNINGIRNVWAKLIASEMKLDMMLWTTRISGLVECGDTFGAIEALGEMVKLWEESSKDESSKAIKPTIEPVNAVFSGLLLQNQVTEAENLLDWAIDQGIEPDIYTYNPLLRRYIQEGRTSAVRKLFETMKERGINADAATFTTLIDVAFSQIDPDDQEGEARAVTNILESMEKVGLEVNLQNYAKIIYKLLQGDATTKSAVQHVLLHLWNRGYELTQHIYTMLVDYYFSQDPADINAIDSLLQRRRIIDYDDADVVFYDRIILGYSLAGLPERALHYYYKLARSGVITPLNTQSKILLALIQKNLEEEARDFVESSRSIYEEKHKNGEVKVELWDHIFWRLAATHGLLELDQLPGRRA
ncbi:uncharacterized protein GGS22DRAFT_156414 [Annulohypoxylon maeteangense]|uniref:uncharacterized protein n=1 Tax=Annulohypoxylon maeteangense TaxID=1927788 RepID=UPI0020080A24|nr:uncharacterized protein GGS22DRAFT_156414 [Annulohypoxylon maeteangense]KAI0887199.1 hypothetical protein GGS22DRAFT_156414 [Annulohypoxylon maeteangense]